MKVRHFEWSGAHDTAEAVRRWARTEPEDLSEKVEEISREVEEERDIALRRLTARLDATELEPHLFSLRVDPEITAAALAGIDGGLRESLEVAAANIKKVAESQVSDEPLAPTMTQGQTVTVREVPVSSVGVYAPGGRAVYPSSVLMCAIPAQVAGVGSISLASPPGPNGDLADPVLAAAALCGIDEIYAMGGAQAIFALTFGTETVKSVDVVVGPGNPWVQEAKRAVMGMVGIDSYAGPSELMLIAGHDTNVEWAALDLCAQAEHGPESRLIVVAVEQHVLDAISDATEKAASTRPSVFDAPLALVRVPDLSNAIELANSVAPEHLELLEEDAVLQADQIRTAGCVFAGRYSATAFGDYVAGSNHVLPTTKTGRFSGPLGPAIFRRKIATVEVPAGAAAKLAPHVDVLARAEGFPVHGESAMIRAEDS
jgi:histidinol dehydrogenase